MKKVLFALFAVSVVATVPGCETPGQVGGASADKGEAEVITGSRLPRKSSGSEAVSTQGGGSYKHDKN